MVVFVLGRLSRDVELESLHYQHITEMIGIEKFSVHKFSLEPESNKPKINMESFSLEKISKEPVGKKRKEDLMNNEKIGMVEVNKETKITIKKTKSQSNPHSQNKNDGMYVGAHHSYTNFQQLESRDG